MKIRFKKLNENAVMPTKAHASDAGFDLTATSRMYDNNNCYVYGCGLAVEIPEGYVGLVFPRSSIANKDLLLSNSVASENPTPTPAPDNNEGPSSPDNTDNDNNPPFESGLPAFRGPNSSALPIRSSHRVQRTKVRARYRKQV